MYSIKTQETLAALNDAFGVPAKPLAGHRRPLAEKVIEWGLPSPYTLARPRPLYMSPDKSTLDKLRIERPVSGNRKKSAWPFIAAAIAVAAIIAIVWFVKRPHAVAVKTAPVRVVQSGTASTLLNASGYVTARRNATVSSKITGKVVEVLVEEGMRVEAGQILARLDSSNVEASLQLAQAQVELAKKSLDEAQASLELSEREYKRAVELSQKAVVSTAELDRAEADVKALRARFERQKTDISVAERSLQVWQRQLEDMIIRAPFDGIVTSKNAQPGEMISPMSSGGFTRTGICTMVDMNSLEIEVDVNENYISRVEPNQPVDAVLDSNPDWHIPAKVIAIIPTADRQKATVKVRIGFGKLDPRILPDMGVKVAFQTAEAAPTNTRSIIVPKAALHQQNGRDIVWVAQDGHAERRAVNVALTVNDEATIAGGLNQGERVIVEGAAALNDGAKITEE